MSKSLPDLCIGLDGPNVRPIGIGTNAWGGVQAANSIPTNSIAVVKSALESGVRFLILPKFIIVGVLNVY